jgi:DNA primase
MNAETIASALGGRKTGQGWMVRCPAHKDREPSLSIRDDDDIVLIHCHAGCTQHEVIQALRERGLWKVGTRLGLPHRSRRQHIDAREPNASDKRRTATALSIWQSTVHAQNTPVQSYLAARGLTLSPPPTLRFHRGLKHRSNGIWPCMIALVARGRDDTPVAIHRTFLSRDGVGKAPVDPEKMMLGPCRGGAVRLAEPGELLMVGEGIETCLAAMQATGYPAWAALSTSGLRTLDLPSTVREVIVLADGDDPGEAAAQMCAIRWTREGRRVRIARPPDGMDFNDLLLARAQREERAP